jgi:hypothetical protein
MLEVVENFSHLLKCFHSCLELHQVCSIVLCTHILVYIRWTLTFCASVCVCARFGFGVRVSIIFWVWLTAHQSELPMHMASQHLVWFGEVSLV